MKIIGRASRFAGIACAVVAAAGVSSLTATAATADSVATPATTSATTGPVTSPIMSPTITTYSTSSSADAADPCTYGSSGGNVRTCVTYDYTSARVINATRTIKTCGFVDGDRKGCTGFKSVEPGSRIIFSWGVCYVSGLKLCASTYRRNSNGSATEIGHICMTS